MTPFDYHRPTSGEAALALLNQHGAAALLAGGTCLLDLMKQNVEQPRHIIDLNFATDLQQVSVLSDGRLRIGAMARLADVARMAAVRSGWPLLVECIVIGLTPQLREAATLGGNIMQRPRCIYFREPGFACNKKQPGSGCAAANGVHFAHAILGGQAAQQCIAVHPSDLCVGLTALQAEVEIVQRDGHSRTLPINNLHRLPGDAPQRDTTLEAGEMIRAILLPPQASRHAAYVKGPEEGFALASAAVWLELRADNPLTITQARIVLGGVAHQPWVANRVARMLQDKAANHASFAAAADVLLESLHLDYQTAFRGPLLRAVLLEAFERACANHEETA